MRGISCLTQKRLISPEVLCSMELFTQVNGKTPVRLPSVFEWNEQTYKLPSRTYWEMFKFFIPDQSECCNFLNRFKINFLQILLGLTLNKHIQGDSVGKVSILWSENIGHCEREVHMNMCLIVTGYRGGILWICRHKSIANGNKER